MAIFLQNFKLFIKAQRLSWQLFTKSLNTILATIYKSPILFWQLFTKAQILFWQLFTKVQYYFGKNNYIMLKAQKYSLAKTYFHLLKSLTHGKLNYL